MKRYRQILIVNDGRGCDQLAQKLTEYEYEVSQTQLEPSVPEVTANSGFTPHTEKTIPVILCLTRPPSDASLLAFNRQFGAAHVLLANTETIEARPELHNLALEVGVLPCDAHEVTMRLERSRVLPPPEKVAVRNRLLLEQNFIGRSDAFQKSMALLHRYAGIDAPVLITGETGTGKELAARTLHCFSLRKNKPFQALNCGALPDSLVENELFGHTKGAYTDAKADQKGLVALAEGGTLFLDEVDSLSAKAQGVLLRFLQDGHYRPVGASGYQHANVRIVSATNQQLEALAEEHLFRRDLIFRLNALPLALPSLRHRKVDILHLATHFLKAYVVEFGLGEKFFSDSVTEKLLQYDWPGNVRELQNYVQRAYLLTDQASIDVGPTESGIPVLCDGPASTPSSANISFTPVPFSNAKQSVITDFEIDYVNRLLGYTKGNITRAARLAGKERRVFGRLMKKHGIDCSTFKTN